MGGTYSKAIGIFEVFEPYTPVFLIYMYLEFIKS
jgi:hypothetical protein